MFATPTEKINWNFCCKEGIRCRRKRWLNSKDFGQYGARWLGAREFQVRIDGLMSAAYASRCMTTLRLYANKCSHSPKLNRPHQPKRVSACFMRAIVLSILWIWNNGWVERLYSQFHYDFSFGFFVLLFRNEVLFAVCAYSRSPLYLPLFVKRRTKEIYIKWILEWHGARQSTSGTLTFSHFNFGGISISLPNLNAHKTHNRTLSVDPIPLRDASTRQSSPYTSNTRYHSSSLSANVII